MDHSISKGNVCRAILVDLGDTHALVDARSERLLLLDAVGAELWRSLAAGCPPGTRQGLDFAERLVALGLLAALPLCGQAPQADGPEPQILAEAPLQVAANTSDPNPFSADSSW